MHRVYSLIVIALALILIAVSTAYAQTMVLACSSDWGSSASCGGCSGLIASAPSADDKVQTDTSDFWAKLGSLPATAKVSVVSGKTEGQSVACSDVVGTKTAGELLGSGSSTPPPDSAKPAGSITVAWVAPTANTDGTALNNLAGYRIRYGTSQANLDQLISISNPGATSHKLTSLPGATYYFVMTALNASGIESQQSNVVSAAPVPEPIEPTEAWVVAPISGNSRPVYEAVLNAAGALVRGNTEGKVASGKPCGAEVFQSSSSSYRAITESDATLTSQTYRGRQHVAVCVRAQ